MTEDDDFDDRYRRVMLGHEGANGFIYTGIAVLLVDPDVAPVYPRETLETLSRLLAEATAS
ncbi:hypothetical protein D3C83_188440 [compost metagenome]